ncbi:MAG: phytanoyl-CoA dioxygenase family protein [Spirochaetaceae bacterium]|nr:phytanoyl-CoA dioxygenase family protein [Spirochaetaceae bacterium]
MTSQDNCRPGPLSAAEIAAFRSDGIVVPRHVLPAAELALLRTALDRLITDNPGVRPEKLVSAHLEHGTEGVRGNRVFLDIAHHDAVLDAVAQLIGPDIILWGCQVFAKPGGDGMEVPWHQDGQYWPIRPLATCTAWIAIDASTTENGCLRVIPGSHLRHELRSHHRSDRNDVVLDQELDADEFDESTARDVELQPGEMSLHDVYLVHGSRANTSPRRRAGLALRYMPATSHFDRTMFRPGESTSTYLVDFSRRPIWLVRGADRTGKNDFRIGH